MGLAQYKNKRDFTKTSEPAGLEGTASGNTFVIQKHAASHLHYDFRLEHRGFLISWAIPKGPSMKPQDRRLAMQTEDHPLDYAGFEGHIPEGSYGAGDVIVWDSGIYTIPDTEGDSTDALFQQMFQNGHLTFLLHGHKLKGEFGLIRTRFGKPVGKSNTWLLIKAKDAYATDEDILALDHSVISSRRL